MIINIKTQPFEKDQNCDSRNYRDKMTLEAFSGARELAIENLMEKIRPVILAEKGWNWELPQRKAFLSIFRRTILPSKERKRLWYYLKSFHK